jgi:phenylpropionate dioxygenase-like ring-hydroxylating dioxygenase large terminal subunit
VSDVPVQQAVINPDAPKDSLERKQPYIDNGGEMLDKSRYYSPEFMQAEADRLWSKAWLLAGVAADIPEPGDFFVFDHGLESIIVTRTEQGIRAFYNVCAHRGNRLVSAERGNRKVFVCPFHTWSYNNDGSLRHVTDRETFREEVLCHNPGLAAVACDEHVGIIFINMSENPPPLSVSLGLPEGYLEAYNIDRMTVVRHVSSEWAANWKVAVEAFYETYHLHAVHPETQGVMGDIDVQYDLYPAGASRMIVPLGQPSPRMADQETVNEGLQAMLQDAGIDPQGFTGSARDVRRAIQLAKRERAEALGLDYSRLEDGQLSDSWATGLFPNVQIGCHPEGVFIMRFLPHASDPEKFYYDTMTLIFPADDPDYKAPAWMGVPDGTDLTGNTRPACEHFGLGEDANLGQVLSQDSDLLPVVQRGLRSRGFRGQLWGEQEQRLRHFHAELERYLGTGG